MGSGAQGEGWHPVTPSEVSLQETLEREKGLRDSPWAQTLLTCGRSAPWSRLVKSCHHNGNPAK